MTGRLTNVVEDTVVEDTIQPGQLGFLTRLVDFWVQRGIVVHLHLPVGLVLDLSGEDVIEQLLEGIRQVFVLLLTHCDSLVDLLLMVVARVVAFKLLAIVVQPQ